MNPDFRRVALIAAGLGLVVSLFFALRDDGGDEDAAGTTAARTTTQATTEPPPTTSPTTTATTEPSPTTTQGPGTIRIDYTVVNGRPEGGIARDSVARGRSVVIRVTADVSDEVHLHGYDVSAEVAPGAPATIRFQADAPGRFELELEDAGIQIAELEVRP